MYTMYIATTPLFFPLLEQHVQEVMKRKMDTMHHVTKSSHRIVFKKTVPLRYEAQNRWECGDMPKGYHALVVNGSYPEVKRVVLSLAHEASYPLRYAPLEELSHESFAAELSVSLLEHRANKQPFFTL